jgi:hypothetical protein
MQFLLFRVRVLRDRIDDQRIVCTPHDLAALLPSLPAPERSMLLIQVCASPADPRVRARRESTLRPEQRGIRRAACRA